MDRKEIVALVLAGGKGTRLKGLTRNTAKPAVHFGGKYRIVDFVLSNLANSNINNVGLITQYESIDLNQYTSSGKNWGFDGNNSTFTLLSPREKEEGNSWYEGTADAIYKNLDFIDRFEPEYVLIASSDHIYKMNYSKMLSFLKHKNGDVAIACIDVDISEASRFGILETDKNQLVTKFVEKPKKPKSTKASMGIYIFKYKVLYDALKFDAKNQDSSRDFGKDIIPYLLNKKKKIFAFPFKGYWRDVGTLSSLWAANMDLLDDINCLELYEDADAFKIYSEDTKSLPQFVGPNASIKRSMVNQGSKIFGNVDHSVIFTDVVIEEDCHIYDSVIMPGAKINKGTKIYKSIVAPNVVIDENRTINEENIDVILVEK